jgi:tetratricopeptide (TPR) repeat protein
MKADWETLYKQGNEEQKIKNYAIAVHLWLKSIEMSQNHAEPFYKLAEYYLHINAFRLAEAFITAGKKIKKPTKGYIDDDIYEWRFDELNTVLLSYIQPTKENLLNGTIETHRILKKYKHRMKDAEITRIEENHRLFKEATNLKKDDFVLYAITRYSSIDVKKREYMKSIREIWGEEVFDETMNW